MPEKTIAKIFTMNLARELLKRNITYAELAENLGISRSTISMWKSQKSLPRMDLLDKIADYLGITVSDLTTDNSTINERIYFLNDDTAEMADKIFNNKELRMLFDAAKDADPEDLEAVHNMLLALKRKERREDLTSQPLIDEERRNIEGHTED